MQAKPPIGATGGVCGEELVGGQWEPALLHCLVGLSSPGAMASDLLGTLVGLPSAYPHEPLPFREDTGKPEPPEAKLLHQGNQISRARLGASRPSTLFVPGPRDLHEACPHAVF